jgi:hypothetical protein
MDMPAVGGERAETAYQPTLTLVTALALVTRWGREEKPVLPRLRWIRASPSVLGEKAVTADDRDGVTRC